MLIHLSWGWKSLKNLLGFTCQCELGPNVAWKMGLTQVIVRGATMANQCYIFGLEKTALHIESILNVAILAVRCRR